MIVNLWRCLFAYKLTEQKRSQAQTLLISGDFCSIVRYLTGSDCQESYQEPTHLFVIVERFTLRWRRGIFKCVFLIPATLKVMGLIQKHFIRQHLLIQPNSSLVFVSSHSHSFPYQSKRAHKPIFTPWSPALMCYHHLSRSFVLEGNTN